MKVSYTNFSGGETSPSLATRYDLSKFRTSCRHLENFLPELHGPLARRTGTRFLEDLGGEAVLIPFEFSADPSQNYALIFQEGRIRIAQKYGFVTDEEGLPVTLDAPYTAAQLYDISFAQSGDIVYLAHNAHPLHKLVRTGHAAWELREVRLMPDISPPQEENIAIEQSSTLGGTYELRYKICSVSEDGRISAPSSATLRNAKHPSDWVVGDYVRLFWPLAEDAVEYNIYRQEAGVYGLIGVAGAEEVVQRALRDGSGEADHAFFRDDRYTADQYDTPPMPDDPFILGNHPGLVSFHQQRLVLASPRLRPQTWHTSRTGSYEDFAKSRPLKDDDALEFTLASGRIDMIQWIASFGDLLIGTAGGEYKAIGADGGAITPKSLNIREQSYWGSMRLRPLVIGNSVLHVQRQGSRVRDLSYSLERDGYAGNDLSVLASHLFDNHIIKQWDYQQSPGSRVFCVRDDGMLLSLTYMREHDIWGWSRITTQGRFRSVCVNAGQMEDDLYAVVEREIGGEPRWYLERFEPRWLDEYGIENAFYVDSGLSYEGETAITEARGLDHLEGCEVSILADGSPLPEQVVRDGKITLRSPAKIIHVGLPYVSSVCPQTPEADTEEGATLGRQRSYGKSRIRLASTVGGSFGPSPEELYEFPFSPREYDEPMPVEAGDRDLNANTGFSPEGRIWIFQDKPLPMTIVALVLEVNFAN